MKKQDFGALASIRKPRREPMHRLVDAPSIPQPEVPERKARIDWSTEMGLLPLQWLSGEEQINEQMRQASLALVRCVEINVKKLGGVPVLKGTRFPIAQVLSQIADGDSTEDLAENLDLDRGQLEMLLHALAASLNRPFYK